MKRGINRNAIKRAGLALPAPLFNMHKEGLMGLFTFIVKKIYEGKEEKQAPVSTGDRVVLYAP